MLKNVHRKHSNKSGMVVDADQLRGSSMGSRIQGSPWFQKFKAILTPFFTTEKNGNNRSSDAVSYKLILVGNVGFLGIGVWGKRGGWSFCWLSQVGSFSTVLLYSLPQNIDLCTFGC